VNTLAVGKGLSFMTNVAPDGPGLQLIIGMVPGEIRVATGTGVGRVAGSLQSGVIHIKRTFTPVFQRAGQFHIRMAFQTLVVGNRLRGGGGMEFPRDCKEQKEVQPPYDARTHGGSS
jgi:hypothetical protein